MADGRHAMRWYLIDKLAHEHLAVSGEAPFSLPFWKHLGLASYSAQVPPSGWRGRGRGLILPAIKAPAEGGVVGRLHLVRRDSFLDSPRRMLL
jgi:hypothetical protein